MEILLWLVPPVVVAAVAMLWASWVGREGRGEVDHDEAVRRLGVALEKDAPVHAPRATRTRQRSTGVALRRRRTPVRTVRAQPSVPPSVQAPAQQPPTGGSQRRAS